MIEQSLQEAKFINEYQKLRVNLLYTANWLNNRIREILRPFGITQKQYNILKILRTEYPQTIAIQDVRCRMIDKMSDASRIIDRLVLKGWVEKQCCSEDKRSNRVQINAAGLNLLKKIDATTSEIDGIMSNIDEEKAATLNLLLNELRD